MEFQLFQEFGNLNHAVFLRHFDQEQVQAILRCFTFAEATQVHGKMIVSVEQATPPFESDALLTAKQAVGLVIRHADCQAAIFYDPIQEVIGNVHCGWRGNVQNIYHETVEKLKIEYGCKPENLLVGISPSLGPCCAQFIHYHQELPSFFWPYQVKPLYFDLWEISRQQLYQAGVLPHHIEIASICTCCNPSDYFSYRRDKGRGRNRTIISRNLML